MNGQRAVHLLPPIDLSRAGQHHPLHARFSRRLQRVVQPDQVIGKQPRQKIIVVWRRSQVNHRLDFTRRPPQRLGVREVAPDRFGRARRGRPIKPPHPPARRSQRSHRRPADASGRAGHEYRRDSINRHALSLPKGCAASQPSRRHLRRASAFRHLADSLCPPARSGNPHLVASGVSRIIIASRIRGRSDPAHAGCYFSIGLRARSDAPHQALA